jgi:spore maturation protein CgeB
VSAYWNGAATYYRGIIRALHGRGHRITFYEPDAYDRQQHRDIPDPDWARVVVYSGTDEREAARAIADARNSDVIVKTSGVGVFDEFLEREVLAQRHAGSKVVFWDVDAPATLDRLDHNLQDLFHALIPHYDMVLTYGGGDPVVSAYLARGARQCVPIYNALDPDTHHPVPPQPVFESDLAFLGNRLPDREARVEEYFFKPATLLPDRQFLLGGNGWHDKAMPANVKYAGHVYTRDHNAFNCTPLAVVNISRSSMAAYGFSPATRVFEAAGAGACIITDTWKGIKQFLTPDHEVLVAESGEQVAAHLAALTPARARDIGQAARTRVLSEHTYAHRVAQVEALFEASPVTATA